MELHSSVIFFMWIFSSDFWLPACGNSLFLYEQLILSRVNFYMYLLVPANENDLKQLRQLNGFL